MVTIRRGGQYLLSCHYTQAQLCEFPHSFCTSNLRRWSHHHPFLQRRKERCKNVEYLSQATLPGNPPHFFNHCPALQAYISTDHHLRPLDKGLLHTSLAPVGAEASLCGPCPSLHGGRPQEGHVPHPRPQLIGLGRRLAWKAANLHGRAGHAKMGRTNQIPVLRPGGEKQRRGLAQTLPRGQVCREGPGAGEARLQGRREERRRLAHSCPSRRVWLSWVLQE